MHGVEIAPTAIWSNLDQVSDKEVLNFREYLNDHNLVVSGIQSLLYGHPELQLLDQRCWKNLRDHLVNVIRIGGLLRADVAVFGSPRNRVRGELDKSQANEVASTFLKQLIPSLEENKIVLTLEPNAPDYGADFLTTYEEVIDLSRIINSEYIKPQMDTGCMWMVGLSPEQDYLLFKPHHIHLSVPKLKEVPGVYSFAELLKLVHSTNYEKWLVIEMLGQGSDSLDQVLNSIEWLKNTIEGHIDV